MSNILRLKYLLEFHIFLCVLGPLFIVFHTSFKFGGIVSIAFWCMVAVVASGVVGRFIYIQIPRTIEGRAIGLNELKMMRMDLAKSVHDSNALNETSFNKISRINDDFIEGRVSFIKIGREKRKVLSHIKNELKSNSVFKKERNEIIKELKKELDLSAKIGRLQQMQDLLKYWHVAHLPFALIMLIIVIIHVIVSLAFGYKWIF